MARKFAVGTVVEIGFNAMPDEERKRLENAISVGKISGRADRSRVDQGCHQTVPDLGTIEDVRESADAEGKSVVQYGVRLTRKDGGRGRLRLVPEDKLTAK